MTAGEPPTAAASRRSQRNAGVRPPRAESASNTGSQAFGSDSPAPRQSACAFASHAASAAPVAWRACSAWQASVASSMAGSQAARKAGQSRRSASAASHCSRNADATGCPRWRARKSVARGTDRSSMPLTSAEYSIQPASGWRPSPALRAASASPRPAASNAARIDRSEAGPAAAACRGTTSERARRRGARHARTRAWPACCGGRKVIRG